MTVPLLEATGLHTYYGASHVLHGIDLRILPGECVTLMGRNGMGKTTTIRSLLGLTPPRAGEVRVRGKIVTGLPPHRIAQEGIALIPEGRGIFPTLTARENLTVAARPGRWTPEAVLDLFPSLRARLHHLGSQLSGGEQQMLSIGRALMTNPELVILDGATEGLAPLVRRQMVGAAPPARRGDRHPRRRQGSAPAARARRPPSHPRQRPHRLRRRFAGMARARLREPGATARVRRAPTRRPRAGRAVAQARRCRGR